MQKLQAKLKNAPRNTSLVPCSVSSVLNKDNLNGKRESPSVQSKILTCNNSEENQRVFAVPVQNLRVSVVKTALFFS